MAADDSLSGAGAMDGATLVRNAISNAMRTAGAETLPGDRLWFLGASDLQARWAGTDDPRPHCRVGEAYEVALVEVHSTHTRLTLVGLPDLEFNSVCFTRIDPPQRPTARRADAYIQAVGMASALKPSMTLRADDPVGMMREVVAHVAAERGQQWQPIESAPFDADILVWCRNEQADEALRTAGLGDEDCVFGWHVEIARQRRGRITGEPRWQLEGPYPDSTEMSHWMPLPKAPSGERR